MRQDHIAFASSITPFTATGELDLAGLRAHLRHLAEAGVTVCVAGSGSGEANAMSEYEIRQVLTTAVDELKGVGPVYAMGREPRTAADMIAFVGLCASSVVDVVQMYPIDPGHSTALRDEEMADYYETVLDATDHPCVLSLHYAVGYRVPQSLVERLVLSHSTIVGLNVVYPELSYVAELLDRLAGRVPVYVGGVGQIASGRALGAAGFVAAECNIAPRLCASVASLFGGGATDRALDAYGRLLRVSSALSAFDNVTATKTALRHAGRSGGYVRAPRKELRGAQTSALLDRLARSGSAD